MHDIKGNYGVSDRSRYLEKTGDGWPVSNLGCTMSVDDFANGNEKEVTDFVTSNCHSSKITDPFQKSVFYLDKSVMECALPELVVCYKESRYHVVKDICIDEGVPTQDTFLFDCGVDEMSNCNFVPSKKDQDSKLLKEKSESGISMQENQTDKDIKDDCEPNKGIPSQCDSKDLMMSRERKDEKMKMITNDVSKGLFTLGELLSMPELSTENSEAMYSDCKRNGIEQCSFQASAFGESTSSSLVNEVSDDSKLVVRSITVGSDSSALANSNDEGCHNLEDTSDQPFSDNLQRGHGESSFSAAGHVTGLVTYSGPIAYSGSLSHRSDSSTTSTRSFAFPILQSEWNSSPVRMAKADRRQYRKHRGWRQGILCCRF